MSGWRQYFSHRGLERAWRLLIRAIYRSHHHEKGFRCKSEDALTQRHIDITTELRLRPPEHDCYKDHISESPDSTRYILVDLTFRCNSLEADCIKFSFSRRTHQPQGPLIIKVDVLHGFPPFAQPKSGVVAMEDGDNGEMLENESDCK